jgi:hypothetical protein
MLLLRTTSSILADAALASSSSEDGRRSPAESRESEGDSSRVLLWRSLLNKLLVMALAIKSYQ